MSAKMVRWGGYFSELKRLQGRIYSLEYKRVEQYRDLVRKTLELLAESSPQWSGLFAASWKVEVTGGASSMARSAFSGRFLGKVVQTAETGEFGEGGYRSILIGNGTMREKMRWMGDQRAVEHAIRQNIAAINSIRSLSTRVSFSNPTSYASIVQDNKDPSDSSWKLRPGNYMGQAPVPIAYVRSQLPGLL